MKGGLVLIRREAQKVLQIGVFGNLLHQFTIGDAEAFLYNECAQREA